MNWFSRAASVAALLHIAPAVVLVKRPDAVQALLPGADAYFAREVHLSAADAHRLHEAVDWSPEDGVLAFYTGKAGSAAGWGLGVVRVGTPPRAIEVAGGGAPPPRPAGRGGPEGKRPGETRGGGSRAAPPPPP